VIGRLFLQKCQMPFWCEGEAGGYALDRLTFADRPTEIEDGAAAQLASNKNVGASSSNIAKANKYLGRFREQAVVNQIGGEAMPACDATTFETISPVDLQSLATTLPSAMSRMFLLAA
jgi:hypothetical protein